MVLRFIFIAFLLLLGCGEPSFDNPTDPRNVSPPSDISYSNFTDDRDGKSYRIVVIGTQTWMAENLNYKVSGSKCMDNANLVDDGGYCDIYGRFYNWKAAKKACPSGWHLPGAAEWYRLWSYAYSWTYLKSKQGWPKDQEGIDFYGFTALPSGSGLDEIVLGENGCWWIALEADDGDAYLICTTDDDNPFYRASTSSLLSVRCIQDEPCGSGTLNDGTKFCYNGRLYDLCGGIEEYNVATEECVDNKVVSKSSSSSFVASSSSARSSSSSVLSSSSARSSSSSDQSSSSSDISSSSSMQSSSSLASSSSSELVSSSSSSLSSSSMQSSSSLASSSSSALASSSSLSSSSGSMQSSSSSASSSSSSDGDSSSSSDDSSSSGT